MPIPAAVSDSRFFEGLQYLTQLHTLTLSSVRLATVSDDSAIAYFSSCLQTLHSLRSLCVSFAPPVHPEAAQLLSTGIATLQQLTELQLCQTGGHDPEAAAHALGDLCASLHHLSCLVHMQVEGTQLSPECCTSFGQALVCPALSGLQQLTVKSCLLEDGAYQSLAHELQAHVSAVPTSNSEVTKSLGHLGLLQFTWSSIGLKDADCMHLARIISLFPNLDSCSLQGLGLSRMRTHGAMRSALMHLKKLQHVDLRDNGQWSAAQLGLLCCLPRGNPQLRDVDIGKVSDRQIHREGPKGRDLMSKAEKVLKPWKDPMRCLNLQGVTTAYSDYWWAVAIQWSLTGVGLPILGGCVRSQVKKCAA